MSKSVYVLGTGLSHDGSAVLLKDGRVVCGIEKERITRIKRDGGNDTDAVNYCLEAEGIGVEELDLVVQCANFEVPPAGSYRGPRLFAEWGEDRLISISHHLAHAYSAAGASPFDDCQVLVIDGCGSPMDQCVDIPSHVLPEEVRENETPGLLLEKDSFYHFNGTRVTPLQKDFSFFSPPNEGGALRFPTTKHSLGGFYAAVSNYCLGDFNAPGKLMGLAPYGREGGISGDAFECRGGRVFVAHSWRDQLRLPYSDSSSFKTNFQHYSDVALWAQSQLEDALLYLVRERLKQFPHSRLCFTGGVALNAVANARILSEGLVDELFLEPAAGDHGLGLGCAYYGWLEVLKQSRVDPSGSTCFGKPYSASEVGKAIDDVVSPGFSRSELSNEEELLQAAAVLLAEGNVIGWYQGGAEFGPRALGRRSILASPFSPGLRDHINRNIKFREDFRPFAPAVLKEDCERYFQHGRESPYMILVDQVRSEWRSSLGEVSHLDGSARVQTVSSDWNPRFFGLLTHVKTITGEGILLNTSFNVRGVPIVETPLDAIACFEKTGLDALVIGNEILVKNNVARSQQPPS